ncbi:restriction endonuclease [Cellulosimicrobium funkei]|nr:restriction endonuclease [Cellulosimicrobium funkei]
MQFTERLYSLAAKLQQQKSILETEEATKNALVMPFISTILGYDVFNPLEVVPEFTADVGIKKGEKIDYAIVHDGEIQMLIECKKSAGKVTIEHASQLYRYFAATDARIAILTNGEEYQFYTDLDAPNRMDSKPFLVLDLNDIDESLIPELRKLSKEEFDLDSVVNAAEELKYIGALKRAIGGYFAVPSPDWVKFLVTDVYERPITQKVRDQFTPLVAKACRQFLKDQVNERLKAALGEAAPTSVEAELAENVKSEEIVERDLDEVNDDGIETTVEELEGFHIIRAIVCSDVEPVRISHRDAKSYFAVLLDDNNRKPIARLHFNRSQKYLGLFDENKVETRIPIDGLVEIYAHADALRETVRRYE